MKIPTLFTSVALGVVFICNPNAVRAQDRHDIDPQLVAQSQSDPPLTRRVCR